MKYENKYEKYTETIEILKSMRLLINNKKKKNVMREEDEPKPNICYKDLIELIDKTEKTVSCFDLKTKQNCLNELNNLKRKDNIINKRNF